MTHLLILPIALFAAPFWETKDPATWTADEARQILNASPWGRESGTQIYLASAKPAMEAELRLATPHIGQGEIPDLGDAEYRDYLKANPGKHIILAILIPQPDLFRQPGEPQKMIEECRMKVGRKEHKMIGHFPPTKSDPYLRLIFPRVLDPVDNTLSFELYVPSISKPYRTVAFFLKEMKYRGMLEY